MEDILWAQRIFYLILSIVAVGVVYSQAKSKKYAFTPPASSETEEETLKKPASE